jgi:hypothetical protein
MASKLKRVSENTETAVLALAATEGRTFVAQLDRVVDAGLRALGQPGLPVEDTPAPQPAGAST